MTVKPERVLSPEQWERVARWAPSWKYDEGGLPHPADLTVPSFSRVSHIDFEDEGPPVSDHHARKAFHTEHPCQLNAYHAPTPVMTEYHHRKPVFLQNRLYGKILYGPELWVCGNCHDAIHAWLYWLLGEHKQPPYIGIHAKAEAQRTFDWYISEGGTVA